MGNLFITEPATQLVYNVNKVSHFSRRGRAPSRLIDEDIKIFVKENEDSETFCMEGNSEKYTIVV